MTGIDPNKIRCSAKESDYPFVVLLLRYAKGRKLCNCQMAYYAQKPGETLDGEPIVTDYCDGGCSYNQIAARNEVAKEALKEIRLLERRLRKHRCST